MSPFDTVAILMGLAALFGLINHWWLKLPPNIGLALVALLASLAVMALDVSLPLLAIGTGLRAMVDDIDFYGALMNGMLCFLLFAGALHIDSGDLAREGFSIALLATAGVGISTLVVGFGMHWVAGLPLLPCLVFGALISPTDPVAVLGILRSAGVPKSLEVKIAGESLFNDGVGVAVFLIVDALAFGVAPRGHEEIHLAGWLDAVLLFAREALGGVALGAVTGWVTYRLLRRVDEYGLEAIMTLALVMLTYAAAGRLGVSSLIAVVVAGLVVGNKGVPLGMSERTRGQVLPFWEVIDEILNAMLFLLIGIEVLAIPFGATHAMAIATAVPLVLLARSAGVVLPIPLARLHHGITPRVIPVMIWGGLRGGISVALALSLPASDSKGWILAATYGVVVFSIVVQGLTVGRVAKHFVTGPREARQRSQAGGQGSRHAHGGARK